MFEPMMTAEGTDLREVRIYFNFVFGRRSTFLQLFWGAVVRILNISKKKL